MSTIPRVVAAAVSRLPKNAQGAPRIMSAAEEKMSDAWGIKDNDARQEIDLDAAAREKAAKVLDALSLEQRTGGTRGLANA